MRACWLVILVFFAVRLQATLYFAESKKTNTVYFVEIDSVRAIVDVFKEGYRELYSDWFFERLEKIGKTDIVYKGSRIWIRKDIGFLFVVDHIPGTKEAITVRLRETITDGRNFSRERVYWDKKRKLLYLAADSLSGSNKRIEMRYKYNVQGNLCNDTLFLFKKRIDTIYDSLLLEIRKEKDPEVDYFYGIFNQEVLADSSQVFQRLARTNFKYRYSTYIVRHIALNKPEWLIRYVAKKPANEKKLLQSIRRNAAMKEMVSSVKKSPLNLKAKSKITRQKIIFHTENALTGTLYCGIVVTELTLLGLIVYAVAM